MIHVLCFTTGVNGAIVSRSTQQCNVASLLILRLCLPRGHGQGHPRKSDFRTVMYRYFLTNEEPSRRRDDLVMQFSQANYEGFYSLSYAVIPKVSYIDKYLTLRFHSCKFKIQWSTFHAWDAIWIYNFLLKATIRT